MKILNIKSIIGFALFIGIVPFSFAENDFIKTIGKMQEAKIDTFTFSVNGMDKKGKIYLPGSYDANKNLPAIFLIDFTEQHYTIARDEFEKVIEGVNQIEGFEALVVSLENIPNIEAHPSEFRDHYEIYKNMAYYVDGRYTSNTSRTFIGRGSESGIVLMACFLDDSEDPVFENFIATDASDDYKSQIISIINNDKVAQDKPNSKLHFSFSSSNNRTGCINLINTITDAQFPWLQLGSIEYANSNYTDTYPKAFAEGINFVFNNSIEYIFKYYIITNSFEAFPKYVDSSEDTIFINAEIKNPENYSLLLNTKIYGDGNKLIDSIQLFDDGLHNDGSAEDNLFGGKLFYTDLEPKEDTYSVELSITELYSGYSKISPQKTYFTTAGPVVWKGYEIEQHEDSLFSMKVTLENQSSSFTTKDISAKLSTNDNNITSILRGYNPQLFYDIEPGESVPNIGTYGFVFYTKNNPEMVEFVLNIYSDDILYWRDTKIVGLVTDIEDNLHIISDEFILEQNYPNPFNPSTSISYTIPTSVKSEWVNVELIIYDILGREVAVLVNQKQKPGNYQAVFNPSAGGLELTSGIYLYRLKADEYVETKKMIIMK